jgi:hypothetical protein
MPWGERAILSGKVGRGRSPWLISNFSFFFVFYSFESFRPLVLGRIRESGPRIDAVRGILVKEPKLLKPQVIVNKKKPGYIPAPIALCVASNMAFRVQRENNQTDTITNLVLSTSQIRYLDHIFAPDPDS